MGNYFTVVEYFRGCGFSLWGITLPVYMKLKVENTLPGFATDETVYLFK
jgi:hypothetical protein